MVSTSGTPALATPVIGSVRISERKSFSSTQYGPSVTVGVGETHVIASAASTVSFQAGMNNAAPPAPARAASVLLRVIRFFAITIHRRARQGARTLSLVKRTGDTLLWSE